MIQFTVPGFVQAQERPRFSRMGKGVRTHDAPKSRSYKELVKLVAWENKPQKPLDGALRLTIDVYIVPPKNLQTGPKMAKIKQGKIHHTKKPDVENLAKGIMDGMTGIIYTDDSRVVQLIVSKHYDMQPRAEVRIEVIA